MSGLHQLLQPHELDRVLSESLRTPVVLFKHSLICSLSSRARAIVEQIAEESGGPFYTVVVQRARELSALIEEQTGIRHESPQILVIVGGSVAYHASHTRITAEGLSEALSRAQRTPADGNPQPS